MNQQLPIYDVQADRQTGEWVTEPEFSGDYATRQEWSRMTDSRHFHYDTYEHFPKDEMGETTTIFSETRAVVVKYVD